MAFRRLHPAVLLASALVLVAGACGGGGADDGADDEGGAPAAGPRQIDASGGTVVSDDGRFTLDIPSGALSDPVEITISEVPESDWPQEVAEQEPGVVYEMQPDGLEFAIPATATVDLGVATEQDGSFTPPYFFLYDGEDGYTAPEEQSAEKDLDSGEVTATLTVAHFSYVVSVSFGITTSLEKVEPGERVVGQRFVAEAKVHSNMKSASLLTDKVELFGNNPVNAVAGLARDVNLEPIEHSRLKLEAGDEIVLDSPQPEWICVDASPPVGEYGFTVSAHLGGDIFSNIGRKLIRLNPLDQRDWRWSVTSKYGVKCVSPSGDQGGGGETQGEGETGGTGEAGFDYGTTLPPAETATFDWTDTGCETTPTTTQEKATLRESSRGAYLSVGGGAPGGAVVIGGGTVESTGAGGGGTVIRNGQKVAKRTDFEVQQVNDDGFNARVEKFEGPPDADGNLDPATAKCVEGGILGFSIPQASWNTWIGLPTAAEPPIQAGNFSCYIQQNPNGATLYFVLTVDAPPPDPQNTFNLDLIMYGNGQIRVQPEVKASSMGPAFFWTSGSDSYWTNPGAQPPPPADLSDTFQQGGVWGQFDFKPGTSESRDDPNGFKVGDLMDIEPFVWIGIFASYVTSTVCQWLGV